MVQRYKFESKSQLSLVLARKGVELFPMVQRYKFESKSQLRGDVERNKLSCFQWFKDTNLKVNHNIVSDNTRTDIVVSNGSKIQI